MADAFSENPKTLADDGPEPLAVRPRQAWRLLNCGNTYGYELLAAGVLDSYHDGRARKITMASIRRHIARKLAAASTNTQQQVEPQLRRLGRRPKARPIERAGS